MDNLTLRQAISHAIDRNALVDVLGGTIQPGYTLLSPGFLGYNEELTTIQSAWHLTVFPALVLSLTMLAWFQLGDGLRDALDPTLRV